MDYCGQCIHLEMNNKERYSSRDRYWCKEMRRYVELNDRACRYGIEDKTKSNSSGGYQPSGCYITTIVVDILGYEDNCELLNVLRNFRDTVLKTNPQYLPILFEYDQVGPVISEHIRSENNNYRFCLGLMEHFLIPCVKKIKNNEIEEAIDIYKNMVIYLNDDFNLPMVKIEVPSNYDFDTLGKGRIRTKDSLDYLRKSKEIIK